MPARESRTLALLDAWKERLLLALALVLLVLSAIGAFGPREALEEYLRERCPDEARVAPVSEAAAGAGGRIYAGELAQYWKESQRYVFGRKAAVREFVPIPLELPRLTPPAAPGPLPTPGPRLEHTEELPRWTE